MKQNRGRQARRAAVVSLAATLGLALGVVPASGEPDSGGLVHRSGVFPDGQEWQISVPEDWNGTLINDLDAVGAVEEMNDRAKFFLDHGYAYTGTRRHPDRSSNWDPRAESNNMVKVLDLFEQEFGDPKHAIQFGCSGGGSVGFSVAEDHPGRFDGVVSLHASDPITLANMRLDLTFALKALLDPDGDLPLIIADGEQSAADEAWTAALEAARQTEQGRARMALALTLAQYPSWGSGEKPDPKDSEAVQEAMMASVLDGARRAITGRPMWDQPAGLMSWNTGVDYTRFYGNADPAQQKIVNEMYTKAGLRDSRGVQADLKRINAYPRIEGTLAGVNYFRSRMTSGTPLMPVLQISTIGDAETPPANIARYEEAVRQQGKSDLYRKAFIDAPGHCGFNVPETAAAVETVVQRIETGEWKNTTDPNALNALGRSFGLGEPRYIAPGAKAGWSEPKKLNRAFFQHSVYPGDPGQSTR